MKVDPVRNAVVISLLASLLATAVVLDVRSARDAPRVLVPGSGPCPGEASAASPAVRALFCTGRIPVNRASAKDLARLGGLGPARARAIVEHRTHAGPLRGPSDLEKVKGIGPATAAALAPLMDFSADPDPATVHPAHRGADRPDGP